MAAGRIGVFETGKMGFGIAISAARRALTTSRLTMCAPPLTVGQMVGGQNFPGIVQFPWDQKSQSGCLLKTMIKESNIPDGGFGRFAAEPLKKGSVWRSDKIQSVAQFRAENAPGLTAPGGGVAIEMRSAEDIDAWCQHFSVPGVDGDEVELKTSMFIGGVPAERSDRGEALAAALAHSCHCNHNPEKENTRMYVRGGQLVFEAIVDIEAGEELFLNYLDFGLPPFVKEWCARRKNLTDTQSFAESLRSEPDMP